MKSCSPNGGGRRAGSETSFAFCSASGQRDEGIYNNSAYCNNTSETSYTKHNNE